MGRRNKINGQMAFAAIQGKEGEAPEYDRFLFLDQELGITENDPLKRAKEIYRTYMSNNDMVRKIKFLADLEELISQLRSREMVEDQIKLSIQSNYVYARSTFYRKRFEPNDIRTIIGRTDIVGDDVNTLVKDKEFMTMAVNELKEVMSDEIEKTLVSIEENLLSTIEEKSLS